jgi:Na+/H+ antiporter NhaD/arsenite permease-like protein
MSTGGSLATLIALRREKVQITAWEFFKIAVIAMPMPSLPACCTCGIEPALRTHRNMTNFLK